ncbi:unannotated protein [freshwater metagenome]|uniref:Unannotated protein n=1 Tax=freshwater metagenome TaxID=449393 RepID=A0A6J5YYD3_9ZZZZ
MPINPLVDRPQTKNDPVKYQKFLTFTAALNESMAFLAALPLFNTGGTQSLSAP